MFPINPITQSESANYSSVVISTRRVTTIDPYMDSYTEIKYAGVMLIQHSIDSSTSSIKFL